MSHDFNPYHKWLGIPAREQPADHYRLLGVERFETDADVISMAADQRMNFLRQFNNGERAGIAQELLNEISAARVCLLDGKKRAVYDKNLKRRLESGRQSEIATEDLAATLEFSSPEKAPEWPSGPLAGPLAAVDWSPKTESTGPRKARDARSTSSTTKRRIIVLLLMLGIAQLLLLGVLIAAANRSSNDQTDSHESGNHDIASAESIEDQPDRPEPNRLHDTDPQKEAGVANDDTPESDRQIIENENKQNKQRQHNKEADVRRKPTEAEQREKNGLQKEDQQIIERKKNLQEYVDRSIEETRRIQANDPQHAIDILRQCIADVKRSRVPPPFKELLLQTLRSFQNDIRQELARSQKRKREEKTARKEKNEETQRETNSDQYLESLGLVKVKNAWQSESETELVQITRPLKAEIKKYKQTSDALNKRKETAENLEQGLRLGMMKIRFPAFNNPFRNRRFQDWVLDGMPDYPDEPESVQLLVDAGRKAFNRYQEVAGAGAQRLLQEVRRYQLVKQSVEASRDDIAKVLNELEQMVAHARELQRELESTRKRLEENQPHVDEALQSTGLDFKELELKGVENALKKANEILEDDLLESFSDDDRQKN